jgi:hypothetical protein
MSPKDKLRNKMGTGNSPAMATPHSCASRYYKTYDFRKIN